MSGPRPPLRLTPKRLTASDLEWEIRAEQLQFEALGSVRSTAEKWAASVGAIFGIVGTVLVVKGRDDITDLKTGYQIAAGVLLLVAIVAAAWALFAAAAAAQGTPEEMGWTSGPRLRAYERRRAREARGQLKQSRIATVAGIVALLLAICVTWFGETKPKPKDSAAERTLGLALINIAPLRSATFEAHRMSPL